MLSLYPLLILLCLIGNAFFEGIETGIISINRLKLRPHVEEEEPWALRIQAFLDNPGRLFGATLIGTNICMIMGSILAASFADQLLPHGAEFLSGSLMTLGILIGCEYIPKAWFRAHPIARTRPFIGTLEALARLMNPLIRAITLLTDWIIRDPDGQVARAPVMTRDDLLVLTQESTDSGLLTPKQRIMILRVADLSDTIPSVCMTPAAKMTVISSQATVAEFFQKARACGYSNLPVYAEEKKEYVGLVNLFDILRVEPPDSAVPLTRYMKPLQFVKHNTPLTELFPLMRRTRQSLCLVTDAKGDVVGLLTAEDILRLIVGSL